MNSKQSEAQKKRFQDHDQRAKLSTSCKNNPKVAAAQQAATEAARGKPAWNRGKSASEETKRKQSEAKKRHLASLTPEELQAKKEAKLAYIRDWKRKNRAKQDKKPRIKRDRSTIATPKHPDQSPVYYVYLHTDDRGVVFYVGKGKDNRAHSCNNRSKWWKTYVKNHCSANRPHVTIVKDNLTEQQSFQLEVETILNYGRLDLGTGTLINLTCGGDGSSGHKKSQATKDKIRAANTGKTSYNKDRPMSTEQKQKISQAHAGKPKPHQYRSVFCPQTNTTYGSVAEASLATGVHKSSIADIMSGKIGASKQGFTFQRTEMSYSATEDRRWLAGVSYRGHSAPPARRWKAYLKKKHIGYFATEEEAHQAYLQAKENQHD